MHLYMVPQVGLEPTRLSALASKTSVATITPPGQLNLFMNLLKLFHHVIGTIHPIALVRTGVGKLLGILVQYDTPTVCPRFGGPGIEPANTFYCFGPSKKPSSVTFSC
jgi:hypothetical protein